MKKFNIFNKKKFTDKRGIIADIFYDTKINHVSLIETKKNMIRGNHFHTKKIERFSVIKGQALIKLRKKRLWFFDEKEN